MKINIFTDPHGDQDYDFFQVMLDRLDKRKEEIANETNLEAFERTGVINLTETESGDFLWMPNTRCGGKEK